jgi:tetratricopeptide (TPR) repeat protein
MGENDVEFAAIGKLRGHPSLREIQVGAPGISNSGISARPKALFWQEYDRIAARRKVYVAAEALARERKYKEAAALLKDGLRPTDFPEWYAIGVLAYANGDHADYQALCKEMMKRFRTFAEGDQQSVRLCVLAPDSGVSFADLNNLMPPLSLIRQESRYFCFFVFITGMLEYRSGHPDAAVRLLTKVATHRFPEAMSAAAAGLAMAYWQLGNREDAHAELKRARAIIAPFWPDLAQPREKRGWDWWDWLAAELLIEEADKLINSDGL